MEKCKSCINSRRILSENGEHYNCTLEEKEAIECMAHNYSRYFSLTDIPIMKSNSEYGYYDPNLKTPIDEVSDDDIRKFIEGNSNCELVIVKSLSRGSTQICQSCFPVSEGDLVHVFTSNGGYFGEAMKSISLPEYIAREVTEFFSKY